MALIPIALKNYGLALLSVHASHYFGSLVGWEVLNSVVLVYAGAVAGDLTSLLSGETPKSKGQLGMMAVGCAVTVVVMAGASRFARKALQEARAAGEVRTKRHDADANEALSPFPRRSPRRSPLRAGAAREVNGAPGRPARAPPKRSPSSRTRGS